MSSERWTLPLFIIQPLQISNLSNRSKEIGFQFILHAVVFLFYAFENRAPHLEAYRVSFFLNYTLVALFVNYVLLPRFFYPKRYLAFAAYVILAIGLSMWFEEGVLEQIYFPGPRAENFPGVFVTLVQMLPVIAILVGFKFAYDALTKQNEVEALQGVVQASELQFLKSQINPHFLFNNLNNLYSYALEQSPKTPTIILELSGVLRYMLYECREAYVPLQKEVAQLQNFVQLYELQIEERGKVRFQATGEFQTYEIAPLILVVFIENAFKHSQAGQSQGIDIDIQLEVKADGQLHFSCKNNYLVGQSSFEQGGIGLGNVRKRLALLYPDQYQLQLQQSDDYYEVNLHLNLSQHH